VNILPRWVEASLNQLAYGNAGILTRDVIVGAFDSHQRCLGRLQLAQTELPSREIVQKRHIANTVHAGARCGAQISAEGSTLGGGRQRDASSVGCQLRSLIDGCDHGHRLVEVCDLRLDLRLDRGMDGGRKVGRID
jgi:hypothetical protein